MSEDRFITFLQQYYNKNKTINDIPRDLVVDYEGTPLKIGEFLGAIRRQHRLYIKGKIDRGCKSPLTLSRYEILDSMNFIWDPQILKQQQLQESDPCLNYILNYYDENNTFNNLPEKVIINGQEYNIRSFLSHVRTNHKRYLSGNNQKGSDSETSIKRYKALDERGFDWEPKLRKQKELEKDDKFIRFLEIYYKEHQTLDNVPKTVIFEGEELSIDNFLSDRRKKHRKREINPNYKPSILELKRQQALDDMHYDWNFHQKRKQELLENDPYIRYLKWHHNKYGTINNIAATEEVEFEGQILKIGVFINDYRKKHYAYTTKNIQTPSVKSPLALKRYQELEMLGIDWRPSESLFSVTKHARKHEIRTKTLKKYIAKFNGDIEKATKICQALRRHNSEVPKKASTQIPSLKTVAEEFEIDIDLLINLLSRPNLRTKEPSKPLMYDEKTNLRQFCIENGLNYTVIQKAIKLRMNGLCPEDLQSLINRCIVEYKVKGQKRPATWIYSKYGNEILVTHLLTSMHLDPEAILADMSKNCITLEEAIENDSFKRSSAKEFAYLEPLYHELIEFYNKVDSSKDYTQETAPIALISYFENLIKEYNLTQEEFNILQISFVKYTNAIEQYKLYNVGFEKDPEKRLEKIIFYNFDDDEIEEAFFMPLKFNQKVLIGRDSEMYKRRVIIKNLTISWNYLSEEQQQEKIDNYHLTGEELTYITKTRQEINETKTKAKVKQQKAKVL